MSGIIFLTSDIRNEISIERKLKEHDKQKEENKYYDNLIDLKSDITKWKNNTIEILDDKTPAITRSSGEEIRELISDIKELRNEIQELKTPKLYKGTNRILEEMENPLWDATNRLEDVLSRVDGSNNLSSEYLQTIRNIIVHKIQDALSYIDLAIEEVDEKKTYK